MSQITVLADEYYAYRQSTDLFRLLYFGRPDHLERWEDVTSAGLQDRQRILREHAERADELVAGASAAARSLLDTLAFTARSTAHGLTWRTELTTVNPAFGIHTTLLTFLGRFQLVTAEHGDAYLAKLRALPDLFDDIADEVDRGAGEGRVALRRHLDATADALDRYLRGPRGADDPLAQQAPPADLGERDREIWCAEVARVVADEVRPAVATYAARLRNVAERGRPDEAPGLCHLEGGSALYGDLIWSHTTLDLTAEEVHRIGLAQIERLEDEYRSLAGPLLGVTEIADIYRRLRDDPALRYTSGADIVRDATAALAKAAAAAPGWFHRLPQAECYAAETAQGPLAFYSTSDPATGRPGQFFFNTSDPSAWGTYQLENTTFHEAIPGHHFQLGLHAESDDLHDVQRHLGITAYLEGWGLYTERLADEMGLYSSDLDRVGMLAADSMRACRLVVDTGLHALGWSRQEAIDFMVGHSPLSVTLVEGEIDRYIGMPGQALSYMIGRLEIDRVRAEAESHPGFDIKEFHDRILRNGMVTLPMLRELVLED